MRKKFPWQGGITKYLCQQRALFNRQWFKKNIESINLSFGQKGDVNMDVISFSGSSSFEDQVLSIYSFIFYAGKPVNWTVYSDKSYSPEEVDYIVSTFPFVTFLDWDVHPLVREYKVVANCIAASPAAKKLNVVLGHPYQRQTLYVDSDIVFYKNSIYYLNSPILQSGLWYLADNMGDDLGGYFSKGLNSFYPLNFGMLIINQDFDRSDVLYYLNQLNGNYHYFSDQSAFDFAFKKQGAEVFDPRQFIIDIADQFDFSSKYYPDAIAIRHYVTPVRHKMFQYGWKWHFSS